MIAVLDTNKIMPKYYRIYETEISLEIQNEFLSYSINPSKPLFTFIYDSDTILSWVKEELLL
jgi:hypothetical protein